MIVDIDDIRAASIRTSDYAVKTPLLISSALNQQVGAEVFLKCENLQLSGSFKFRGAYNLLCQLTKSDRSRGGVATSSGNHAQGFAAAAKILGMRAIVAMPHDTPQLKLQNTEKYGAEIVHYDRVNDDETLVRETLASERNAVLVPPFDHPQIIAGQGTVALEIVEQVFVRKRKIDTILIPCGGGGLAAGCAAALSFLSPSTRICIVEPEGFDDTRRSLSSATLQRNAAGQKSICDALLVPEPGKLTFPILQSVNAQGLVVSDDEVRHAVRVAFNLLKLVLEPGGAVALAALLSHRYDFGGQHIAIVLSGGNIDRELMAEILR